MVIASCVSCLLLLLLVVPSQSEQYTSSLDLTSLVHLEKEILRATSTYVETQQTRLAGLKETFEKMKEIHTEAIHDPKAFIEHPLNSYFLIRRLTADWTELKKDLLADAIGENLVRRIEEPSSNLLWPDEEDLSGAVEGLARLQDTYELPTKELATGKVYDRFMSYKTPTAYDCLKLGDHICQIGDYSKGFTWLQEAKNKLEELNDNTTSREEVLEHFALCAYRSGNLKRALHLTQNILELNPSSKKAAADMEKYLNEEEERQKTNQPDLIGTVQRDTDFSIAKLTYLRLCRGETRMPQEMKKKLHCYLKKGPSPHLRISPFKTEMAHINPNILLFHNIISDHEIEIIKYLSSSRLERAEVFEGENSAKTKKASYRISKVIFLPNTDDPVLRTLDRRIQDATDLDMRSGERLQVANYGIGGFYSAHYDHRLEGTKDPFEHMNLGNRIATFMFYMSEVKAGGATVFPYLEVSVKPQKGSAVFWYNLHPSGKGDYKTFHGACPVLVGHKWASNKWIHEKYQEFRRPCTLNEYDP